MKILRFAGPSSSGKTTLIVNVLHELKRRGLHVATIKHSHHQLTFPAKDSTRFYQEGSDFSVVLGTDSLHLTMPLNNKSPQELIDWLFPDIDIVLIEGWRSHDFPTILVSKVEPPPEWTSPTQIIGYVGWSPNSTAPLFTNVSTLVDLLMSDQL